jgi:hypothetical protein
MLLDNTPYQVFISVTYQVGDICLYRRFSFVRDEILTEISFRVFCARECISSEEISQKATTLNRKVAGSYVILRKYFVT